MKYLIIAFALLSAIPAPGRGLKDLLGNWTGTENDRISDSSLKLKAQLKDTRLSNGTIRLELWTEPFSKFNNVTRYDFLPTGKYTEIFASPFGSKTVVARGKWEIRGGKIWISATRYRLLQGTGTIKVSKGSLTYTWREPIQHVITIKAHR
jgi:hypothetical protein